MKNCPSGGERSSLQPGPAADPQPRAQQDRQRRDRKSLKASQPPCSHPLPQQAQVKNTHIFPQVNNFLFFFSEH